MELRATSPTDFAEIFQDAAASRLKRGVSGILDRPVKPDDDIGELFEIEYEPHHVIARSDSDEAIHASACLERWIASRSLSSGARFARPVGSQ
jgi:hypothetical protein